MPKSETVSLLKGLDHRFTVLGAEFKTLDGQVKSLDGQVKALDGQVKNIDGQVKNLDRSLRHLDHRVGTIEQILPTLATKEDLKAFPTEADPKGFATKKDLYDGLREEGERSRRHMTLIAEDLRDMVNRALDGHLGHTQRLDEHGVRLDGHDAAIDAIDVRVTAVERPHGTRR
jgi:hypothetical protein